MILRSHSIIGTKLGDVNLSQAASLGSLIFARVVPTGEFSMTSGVGFLFSGKLQEFLKRGRHQVTARKVKDVNEAAKRYVAFYGLNRAYGMESRFV